MTETAIAELHYIDFGEKETFEELAHRHGLEYLGETDHFSAHSFLWTNQRTDVQLITACNPVTGDHQDDDVEGRLGYASYVRVQGPLPSVESLYRDVIETAAGIKGEFKPLTTTDGEVIAENWRGRDGL